MRDRELENFMSSHQVPKAQIHSTAYDCPNLLEHLVTQQKTIVYAQPQEADETEL